jgi:multicomponent K+:H+ antiporter subunit E
MLTCKYPESSQSRWLPHPLMTVFLCAVWLLLVNTVSFAHILLGTALGIIIPWFTNRFWPERPRIARPGQMVYFFFVTFLWDVLVANIAVVRMILHPDLKRLSPGFFEVPLDTSDPMVITILTSVISLTPGTVSAEVWPHRRVLLIHGLNVPDPDVAARTIKTRYEAPLKEIFSC